MRDNEPDIESTNALFINHSHIGAPAAKVFAAPWEAGAFALAVTLSSSGLVSWQEWTATLAEELRKDGHVEVPRGGPGYYHHWLTALEQLVKQKGIVDDDALQVRKIEWIEAFSSTPHGQPVELRR